MHHAIVLGNIPTKMSGHLSDFDIFYECCWQPWQTRQVYPISVCVLGCLQSTNVHFFCLFFYSMESFFVRLFSRRLVKYAPTPLPDKLTFFAC